MSRKNLYFKITEGLDSVFSVRLIEGKEKEYERQVIFENRVYEVVDELPDKAEVYGYIETCTKENKKTKVDVENIKCSIERKVVIKKEKSKSEKIIGYVKLTPNEYIALTEKKKFIIPILLFILIGILFMGIYTGTEPSRPSNDKEEIVFKDDDGDKGKGELGEDEFEFGEQTMFRMRLNCTPAVEDNKINLRLESPAEENKDLAFVVKVYVTEKMDEAGNTAEQYEEEKFIYESPLVYADENIDWAELDEQIESGKYNGRAVYYIYNLDRELQGTTACRLQITVK